MMRLTRDRDTKTLRYDWFLSEDGTECEVRGLRRRRRPDRACPSRRPSWELSATSAYDHSMTLYDEPSPALAELMETRGVVPFRQFSAAGPRRHIEARPPYRAARLSLEGVEPVNESHVTQTAFPKATPPRSEAVSRLGMDREPNHRDSIGTLLVLVSLALLGAGGTALWADRTQRDGGYVTTDVHDHVRLGTGDSVDRAWIGGSRLAVRPGGCSTKFGYESRRRAPAWRYSSGSARPRTSIATSQA